MLKTRPAPSPPQTSSQEYPYSVAYTLRWHKPQGFLQRLTTSATLACGDAETHASATFSRRAAACLPLGACRGSNNDDVMRRPWRRGGLRDPTPERFTGAFQRIPRKQRSHLKPSRIVGATWRAVRKRSRAKQMDSAGDRRVSAFQITSSTL